MRGIKMFKWLVTKGFKIVWKKLFGINPELDPRDDRIIDNVLPNLEKQLGIKIHRSWWDSLIDGINRLPRPVMTFGTVFLFFYAIYDPFTFSIWMTSLQGIPENLWYIMMTVILFWFGGKIVEKTPLVNKTTEYIKLLAELKKNRVEKTDDVKDTKKPLSEEAIEEWNKRNNPNFKIDKK